MVDVFNEVDEQVRSARLQLLLKRGWPYATGLIVVAALLGLAAWVLNQREVSEQTSASELYDSALQSLGHGDLAAADQRFGQVAATGPHAFRALALIQQAGIRANRGQVRDAVPLLDRAADVAPDTIIGDAARLEAAYDIMDSAPYPEIRHRLEPLSAQGRPYRLMAREALAMIELGSGRIAQARGDYQVISLSTDASDSQRNRAGAALALIRAGTWTTLPTLVKASADLRPEAPPQTPGVMTPPGAQPVSQAGATQ